MGWFGRKKRDPQDANELLRQYNQAEAARISDLTSGSAATRSVPSFLSAGGAAAEVSVEDVFTITGRGQVATGTVTTGTIRVGDAVVVLREGAPVAETGITGIEMFRKRANEASAGTMIGVLLRDRIDVSRGDVIRVASSG
ncbi:EF-Tu/IF-2/RF-3 family GTPase [Microbacterium sp. EST19A]|uniref:EF-Tu/IF-2/RF-3 family GTPase n=1 Tax=Microbacterium sp. EST19A TaxID=2862681 RepID=UPI001CBB6B46|nr:EF-Tu/IF-2/RF-3 family GTPase [Microbacterium sp. EST19A]